MAEREVASRYSIVSISLQINTLMCYTLVSVLVMVLGIGITSEPCLVL